MFTNVWPKDEEGNDEIQKKLNYYDEDYNNLFTAATLGTEERGRCKGVAAMRRSVVP